MSLTQLTDELSKNFDECLETILSVPEQQSNEDEAQENKSNIIEKQMAALKFTFLQLESQLKKIKVNALQDKELCIQETNRLLRRDIEIKKSAIAKYVDKLEEWDKEIPILIEQSNRVTAGRLNGYDFDSNITSPAPQEIISNDLNEDDEDEDEDIEFEEV
ncbi:hypothetical protein G6F37_001533 [Rhizopus arrhizus]|nr:hypothetical protein G6F38_004987 [Rhizopus arrhizus]KAG1163109.1 hypothetical protein G6F37_001533 [Rhizopus arrhizus]